MKLGAAEARVADLTAERDELKKSIEAGAPDAKRTAALEGWQAREVRWDHELYELARRMPADDSVRVSQLTATPIALDKNGKQEAQALINLKLNATSTAAAISLMTAFENDNRGGSKYYVGTGQTILQPGGPSAGKHNQNVTVWTKVRHREPNQYTNVVKFKPPKRTAGVAYGSAPTEADAKQPEPAEEPETAPPPAEKG
jgi:hypothetical protein